MRGHGNPAANPMENGRGDHYWYDEEGQLTDAYYNASDPANDPQEPMRNEYFEYDQLGNRHRTPSNGTDNLLAGVGWVYFARKDTGVNEYRSWNSQVINYDISHTAGNGVLVAEGSFAADYNALNQPRWFYSGNVNGGFMSFGYDPLGRCVKRWAGGASDPATNPAIYFYYDGSSLIQEGPNAGAPSQAYMLGNRVDEIVADYAMANDQWIYHHSDARSHSMMLTDSGGNLVEQYEYDAFGQPYFFSASGQSRTSSNYGNRFLFTGREYLSDLKLYDYRARMYQPELGRFLQPDPKEFAAGDYNLYRYCHNDPVNHSDPTGLSRLTMEGGGDWIKGSDGLSAWDREVGGMPSNRWQAGEKGAGGGGEPEGGDGAGHGPKTSPVPLDNALRRFNIPGAINSLAEKRQTYNELFPNYPPGDPVIAALRKALAEGRIRAGLPGDFYHGNPMTTKNRTILIDPRSRLVESRVSALLAHEGQHLADRDFSSAFARERRAFDVQYGFGRTLGVPDRRKSDADIHAEYGY